MRYRSRRNRGFVGGAGMSALVVVAGLLAVAQWARGAAGADEPRQARPGGKAPADANLERDLVVHEWGTFLGMNGSDGAALDGMYHEEHALPGFVHGRARDQLRLPIMLTKGETPVIYFYTPRALNLRVGVDFPMGIWTHWYPQAMLVRPTLAQQAESPDRPGNGRVCWAARITPPTGAAAPLPATSRDALWNFARDVDAAFVQTSDAANGPVRAESERFLFYRGLGQTRLPMRIEAAGGGTLALETDPNLGAGVRHVYVLRVEGGRGAYAYRPALGPGEQAAGVIPSMDRALPLARFADAMADDLAARLTESGLYPREARAMVNTWKTSYFQNDGVRVLFVLPQSWTDATIPMRIHPRPGKLVRVMVGRLELLSPEREHQAEAAVRDLAAPDAARREQAFAFLRSQGRYVEPIVRRLAATTKDESLRALCRRLLLTGLATDLRAAMYDPVNGSRVNVGPIELRCQLARLYREMGMPEEARAEAASVWKKLRERTLGPNAWKEDDPFVLATRGAFHEARGEDRRAAELYAGSIERLAANWLRPNPDPRTVAALRERWEGRAYAGCLARIGLVDSTIERLREELDRLPKGSDGVARRRGREFLLGFLLEARGEPLDRAGIQLGGAAVLAAGLVEGASGGEDDRGMPPRTTIAPGRPERAPVVL